MKGTKMPSCPVPTNHGNDSFEDILEGMKTDKYWINFFVRPCCPPPPSDQARKMLEKRREEIRGREDLTPVQKDELLAIVDEREEWYMKSPFAKK